MKTYHKPGLSDFQNKSLFVAWTAFTGRQIIDSKYVTNNRKTTSKMRFVLFHAALVIGQSVPEKCVNASNAFAGETFPVSGNGLKLKAKLKVLYST